jgi:DNA-binding transcriptional ArsR family regulator
MSKNRKIRALSDFEKRQIVDARLAGASVIETATSLVLGVPRTTVSKVLSPYTNQGKTTSAKRNRERNSTLTERYHHILKRIVQKITVLRHR